MAITAEVCFINADYFKRYSQVNGSVLETYILPHVILSQEKYIQSYLGTQLYEKLKTDITAATISGDYAILLDTYVRKATLWWSMVDMLPSMHVRIDNGGLVIRSSEDTTPITRDDLFMEVNRARDNAQYYSARLVSYLCNNSSLFPEYSTNTGSDICPTKKVYSQSGFEISSNRR
jgi:hypothetical protein